MDDEAERQLRDTITEDWNQERAQHRQEDQQRHRNSMERSAERSEREFPPRDPSEPDEAQGDDEPQ